jgi:hypothetical protein
MPRSLPLLALLSGCGLSGGKGPDDSAPQDATSRADLLLVIDNSPSMYDTAGLLGFAFEALLAPLGGGDGLVVGFTTTSADPRGSVEPGEAGTLLGDPPVVLAGDEANPAETLRRVLFCEATCWPDECTGSDSQGCVPHDEAHACGDDPGGVVTWEYLACLCGETWAPPECGSGDEEGLEAALLALCRASDPMPEACLGHTGSPLVAEDAGAYPGLLRASVATAVLVATDEGDDSGALAQGDEDPQPYLDAFLTFEAPPVLSVLGPDYDAETHAFPCNSGGATTWGSLRYQLAAERTGGFYLPIEREVDGDCQPTPGTEVLTTLGALLEGLE